ncbi:MULTISPECIES: hypothetical protein [Bacillus cereus group]|uniref:hypothetical protein n=1 Tax=Bacillus cereus group TaxID=86661 RepID=UPI000530D262|nr:MULTISPECIES: hypothetical protein [Bacillus cereus group]KGT40568.1 hypothetical protein IY08_29260 [Bacillus cereus]OFC75831.1 hypothetical protein BTGOE1_35460 [Bacillus thuringiensis]OFC84797.1 hypothetical protein BTGOE2_09940 [Bacillus thuringiensis]
MKLTLFTISNEQIKEQLSKLQTKVESLETVKDVQDKIISAKDSQITFLQGEISSIVTWVTWGAGVVITLASVAFIYIKFLERKAKKKIEEAENTLHLATEKLAEIETAKQQTADNLTESNLRIEQLDILIDKSNDIATVAQEKIDILEEKHKELYDLATATTTNQKIDMSIREIDLYLDMSKNIIHEIISYSNDINQISHKQMEKLAYLNRQYTSFFNTYRRLFSIFSADIAEKQKSNIEEITNGTNHLKMNSINLYKECLDLSNELDLQD